MIRQTQPMKPESEALRTKSESENEVLRTKSEVLVKYGPGNEKLTNPTNPTTPMSSSSSKLEIKNKFEALMFINSITRNAQVEFTNEQIQDIIKLLTGADKVQIFTETTPGCLNTKNKIKDIYIDKLGRRYNFIEMIDEYEFFTKELGFKL